VPLRSQKSWFPGMLSVNCSLHKTANSSTAAATPRQRADPNAKSTPTA